MNRSLLTLAIIVGLFVVVVLPSVYVVDQRETVLVRQFGQIRKVDNTPGIGFKIPYVQDIVAFDRRILDIEIDEFNVTASDQKRLVVDAYARYKITDPVLFAQTMENERGVIQRLKPIMNSALLRVLGEVPLQVLLTERRAQLMRAVTEIVRNDAKGFGIEVIDVRLKQANLPDTNSAAVFNRMKTQRQQEVAQIRGEGAEESQRIRANADREQVVILSDAKRQGEAIRGAGDAEAIKTYADAYTRDSKFYEFYRSLEAYRKSLTGSTLVLSPDGDFFKYFGTIDGKPNDKSRK